MGLILEDVSKSFGTQQGVRSTCCSSVLEGISLRLETGQFQAVLGRSGSGKSTLLRIVAGLEQPSGGHLSLDGRPITGPGPERGMVFQTYSLFPWLSAAENVAFGLRLKGLARAEIQERTRYYLEVVGLAEAARRLPRELSGGMQQRIAIARALAAEPRVLLLDEPFGALDLQIRESLQEFLHALWRRSGLSVLLITHDVDEALLLSQRLHLLSCAPGRIVESLDVDLDKSDLRALRLSAPFQLLRHSLADRLRRLDPELS